MGKLHNRSLWALGALGLVGFEADAADFEIGDPQPTVGVYVGWSFGDVSTVFYGIDAGVFFNGEANCSIEDNGFFSRFGVLLGASGFSPELHAYAGGGYELWQGEQPFGLGVLAGASLHFDDTLRPEVSLGTQAQLGPTDWRATIGLFEENARLHAGVMSPRNLTQCEVVVGRPLRVDGKRAPLPTFSTGTSELSAADPWLKAAQEEWSSVAAFACVATQLANRGASTDLLGRYQTAIADEITHALGAGAMAVQATGQALHLGPPLTARPDLEVDLASIALDAFWDGCVGEGVAALEAEADAEKADGPAQAYLAAVALEEASHAELAWDTVGWVLDQGDTMTHQLLGETLELEPALAGEAQAQSRYNGVLQHAKKRLRTML